MERYLVISSDCHAGLPNAEYRPYLDPQYCEKLDAYLAEREELMAAQRISVDNDDFVKHWEDETGEDLVSSRARSLWALSRWSQRWSHFDP